MINVAICDDDKTVCEFMKTCVEQYHTDHSVKMKIDIFTNGEDIYEKLLAGQYYNIIFIDIELYQMNGIEVCSFLRNELKNQDTGIVFVSGNAQYALDLFELEPMDFILKPIDRNKVFRCLDKVIEKNKRRSNCGYSYVVSKTTKFVALDNILYFQSNGRKITITMVDGKDEYYGKLDEIEEKLKNCFFLRLHQSVLVNYSWIREVRTKDILLKNGEILPISASRKKTVMNELCEIKLKEAMEWF